MDPVVEQYVIGAVGQGAAGGVDQRGAGRVVGDEDEPPGPESVTVPLAGRTELLEAAGEADRLPPVAGTGPSARTSEPVRFAPRRFRACTRTC